MAATGDESAVMDSICKAPAPPTDLQLTAEPEHEHEHEHKQEQEHRRDDATENPKAKRPSTNSKLLL